MLTAESVSLGSGKAGEEGEEASRHPGGVEMGPAWEVKWPLRDSIKVRQWSRAC